MDDGPRARGCVQHGAISPFTLLLPALLISIAYAAAMDRFVDPYFRRLRHKYRAARSAQVPP
jgi:hypothetical protein